jgi:YebC/PmpR family DNA-binding regulatory protein
MSGHSRWAQIKHKKATTDAKKNQMFSKIIRMITVAARKGEDPEMNPELRLAMEKAREINMPADNIKRAIQRGAGKLEGAQMENVRFEAYGPGGVALIIEGITDNKNRTIAEIKHILSKYNAKLAETGSVIWAFEYRENKWLAKHIIEISEEGAGVLDKLLEELDDYDDVQELFYNVK